MLSEASLTPQLRDRQRKAPQRWTLPFRDWAAVVDHCIAQKECKRAKEYRRYLSMSDLNDLLVEPWTQANGCSLATLMSAAQPCDARLMVCNVRITCRVIDLGV